MVEILRAPQRRGLGQKFAESFGAIGQKLPDVFGEIQEGQRKAKEAEQLKELIGEDVSAFSPELRKIALTESLRGRAKAKVEEDKSTRGLSDALDWLDENVEYAGSTSIPFTKSFMPFGKLTTNRTALEKREEINTTGFWAADQVFTHFNKGTVSKEKLKTIQQDLAPRAGISEREYKARVSALRRLTGLPRTTSKAEFDNAVDTEKKAIDKISTHESKNKRPPLSSFHR